MTDHISDETRELPGARIKRIADTLSFYDADVLVTGGLDRLWSAVVAAGAEPKEAAKNIADVNVVTISPGTVRGHASAGGFFPEDVEFLNRETGAFLDGATEGRKKLQ